MIPVFFLFFSVVIEWHRQPPSHIAVDAHCTENWENCSFWSLPVGSGCRQMRICVQYFFLFWLMSIVAICIECIALKLKFETDDIFIQSNRFPLSAQTNWFCMVTMNVTAAVSQMRFERCLSIVSRSPQMTYNYFIIVQPAQPHGNNEKKSVHL